jgi:hypothetical protein
MTMKASELMDEDFLTKPAVLNKPEAQATAKKRAAKPAAAEEPEPDHRGERQVTVRLPFDVYQALRVEQHRRAMRLGKSCSLAEPLLEMAIERFRGAE